MQALELKFCERCGGLWLRPAGSAWSYCRGCKPLIDQLPERGANTEGRPSRRPHRRRDRKKVESRPFTYSEVR